MVIFNWEQRGEGRLTLGLVHPSSEKILFTGKPRSYMTLDKSRKKFKENISYKRAREREKS